jgi:hypothetical protein
MPKRETKIKIGTSYKTCYTERKKTMRRNKSSSSCGKAEIGGETWLSDDPFKM